MYEANRILIETNYTQTRKPSISMHVYKYIRFQCARHSGRRRSMIANWVSMFIQNEYTTTIFFFYEEKMKWLFLLSDFNCCVANEMDVTAWTRLSASIPHNLSMCYWPEEMMNGAILLHNFRIANGRTHTQILIGFSFFVHYIIWWSWKESHRITQSNTMVIRMSNKSCSRT